MGIATLAMVNHCYFLNIVTIPNKGLDTATGMCMQRKATTLARYGSKTTERSGTIVMPDQPRTGCEHRRQHLVGTRAACNSIHKAKKARM